MATPIARGANALERTSALPGLYRFRKGAWVEEGARGAAPAPSGRADILRVSTKNIIAFSTWNGQSYSTFVASVTGCFRTNDLRDFEQSTLAGETFCWSPGVASRDRGLCRLPAK